VWTARGPHVDAGVRRRRGADEQRDKNSEPAEGFEHNEQLSYSWPEDVNKNPGLVTSCHIQPHRGACADLDENDRISQRTR
jgi:hypothetical protein